jgi:hypothetical protein
MSVTFTYPDFNGYALSYLLLAPSTLHRALLFDNQGNPVNTAPTAGAIQTAMTNAGFHNADVIVAQFAPYFANVFSQTGLIFLQKAGAFLQNNGFYSGGGGHPPDGDAAKLIQAMQVLATPVQQQAPPAKRTKAGKNNAKRPRKGKA